VLLHLHPTNKSSRDCSADIPANNHHHLKKRPAEQRQNTRRATEQNPNSERKASQWDGGERKYLQFYLLSTSCLTAAASRVYRSRTVRRSPSLDATARVLPSSLLTSYRGEAFGSQDEALPNASLASKLSLSLSSAHHQLRKPRF
jgi:hypothetical protein